MNENGQIDKLKKATMALKEFDKACEVFKNELAAYTSTTTDCKLGEICGRTSFAIAKTLYDFNPKEYSKNSKRIGLVNDDGKPLWDKDEFE